MSCQLSEHIDGHFLLRVFPLVIDLCVGNVSKVLVELLDVVRDFHRLLLGIIRELEAESFPLQEETQLEVQILSGYH